MIKFFHFNVNHALLKKLKRGKHLLSHFPPFAERLKLFASFHIFLRVLGEFVLACFRTEIVGFSLIFVSGPWFFLIHIHSAYMVNSHTVHLLCF